MTHAAELPQLITMDDLAERLATSVRHVRRLVDDRRIPFVRVGGLVRFDPGQVAAWLDARRDGPPALVATSVRREPRGTPASGRGPDDSAGPVGAVGRSPAPGAD